MCPLKLSGIGGSKDSTKDDDTNTFPSISSFRKIAMHLRQSNCVCTWTASGKLVGLSLVWHLMIYPGQTHRKKLGFHICVKERGN